MAVEPGSVSPSIRGVFSQEITTARDADDLVTEDLAVQLPGDEEAHRAEFRGSLRECES